MDRVVRASMSQVASLLGNTDPDTSPGGRGRLTRRESRGQTYVTVDCPADNPECDDTARGTDCAVTMDADGGDVSKLRDKLESAIKYDDAKSAAALLDRPECREVCLTDESLFSHQGSLLHIAVEHGSLDCGKLLIERGGAALITEPYATPRYRNVTPLHLAVIRQDVKFVQLILNAEGLSKSEVLYAKAQRKGAPLKDSVPWIPIHLAAAIGNLEIFFKLFEAGDDLWVADPDTGNSILHSLCRVASAEPDKTIATFRAVLESSQSDQWWRQTGKAMLKTSDGIRPSSLHVALLKYENYDGMTPFTYASCLGATDLVEMILGIQDVYTFPQRVLGPSMYNEYEMSEIDSALDPPVYQQPDLGTKRRACRSRNPSALEIFVYGLGDSSLKYGELPPIRIAMENKWQDYKWWMLVWFVFHSAVMVTFTISAKSRKPINDNTAGNNTSFWSVFHEHQTEMTCLILPILAAVVYFVLEMHDVVVLLNKCFWSLRNFHATHAFKIPRSLTIQFDIYRNVLLIFSVSVFAIVGIRVFAPQREEQDLAYLVASLTGWSFMLFFNRSFENIGIFAVTIRRMLIYELIDFSAVFVILLLSFSTATSVMHSKDENNTFFDTIYELFQVIIGYGQTERITGSTNFRWVMQLLFCSLFVLLNILFLNMLIAAMSNTFAEINEIKTAMWLKVRTKALLIIERRLPSWLRPKPNFETPNDVQWFLGEERMGKWQLMEARKQKKKKAKGWGTVQHDLLKIAVGGNKGLARKVLD